MRSAPGHRISSSCSGTFPIFRRAAFVEPNVQACAGSRASLDAAGAGPGDAIPANYTIDTAPPVRTPAQAGFADRVYEAANRTHPVRGRAVDCRLQFAAQPFRDPTADCSPRPLPTARSSIPFTTS